ncbi:MAG: hypothetical protein IKT42_03965 [Clostridia bacterium]|nr:hypothetical protein [Clostridia bacterium]
MADFLFDEGKNKIEGLNKQQTNAALQELNNAVSSKASQNDLNTLENITTEKVSHEWDNVPLECRVGYYYSVTGVWVDEDGRKSAKLNVNEGEKYKLTTFIRPPAISGIMFFNENDEVIDQDLIGTGTSITYTDYVFTIPEGCASIAVQSASSNEPVLYKEGAAITTFKAYTKDETNEIVGGLQIEIGGKASQSDVEELENITTEKIPDGWENVALTIQTGYYYYATGEFREESGRKSAKLNVEAGAKFRLSTTTRSTLISGIIYFNINDEVIGHDLDGTGTEVDITNYVFTTPENTKSMVVQSATSTEPILQKEKETITLKAYTKNESDAKFEPKQKYYGVKWDLSNPEDLGERCFDSVGLNATIGIGATNGESDFDNIYPWNKIKRCNISKNANGAEIITFEGESGFALDGSNGDVFVYIPKFYYNRYIKNGFEYRVISEIGESVHPAFIENGVVLDEIFISAFEGYIDDGKMRSIGGVIPSSNETPQTFLNYAKANGDNYSLYDNRCVDLIFTLFAVEFGCRNTNNIFGYGIADFEQPATYLTRDVIILTATNTNTVRTSKWTTSQKQMLPVGSNITVCDTTQDNILTQAKITSCVDGDNYTDWTFDGDAIDVDENCFIGSAAFNTNWCEGSPSGALTWHTGRNNWIVGSNTKNAMRYRWIENIIGNLWHYLPDITFNNLQMYICKNMVDYEFHKITGSYKPAGTLFIENNDNGDKADSIGNNYWITTLDNNIFAKGILFGRTYDKSLTSKKAFGGYYYLQTGLKTIANGGGFDHLYRCNITTQRAWIGTTQKWYLYGARLMYKAI